MANNIEKILKFRGLKITWLARRAGIARSTVRNVIAHKTEPKTETLEKIARVLDLPVEMIINNSKTPQNGSGAIKNEK